MFWKLCAFLCVAGLFKKKIAFKFVFKIALKFEKCFFIINTHVWVTKSGETTLRNLTNIETNGRTVQMSAAEYEESEEMKHLQ